MARPATREDHQERLAETERVLVRLRASFRVEAHLVKKYGVASRTARYWIAAVKKRWKDEAVVEDRTAKRNEMRVTLNEVVYEAMTRTAVVKDTDGKVVLDANPNSPTFGRPVVRQQPDLQRALHAAAQLRALDGLDAPIKLRVDGNASGVLVVGAPAATAEGWAEKFKPPEEQDQGAAEPAPEVDHADDAAGDDSAGGGDQEAGGESEPA